jgi:hypothetical protein
MQQMSPNPGRSPWPSVLKGCSIIGVAPILISLLVLLFVERDMKEGAGWLVVAAMFGVPVFMAAGAIGGYLAHLAQGQDTSDDPDGRVSRAIRVGWVIAGALCGYTASNLPSLVWPKGSLFWLVLTPIGIWIGGVIGLRIARGRIRHRAALGGLIVTGAAFLVIGVIVAIARYLAQAPEGWSARHDGEIGLAALVVGLVAYRNLSRRASEADGGPGASS